VFFKLKLLNRLELSLKAESFLLGRSNHVDNTHDGKIVDFLRPIGHGKKAPDKNQEFEEDVECHICKECWVERLCHTEKSEDHEICEPLLTVILFFALHSLKRGVCRIGEAYNVHDSIEPDYHDDN